MGERLSNEDIAYNNINFWWFYITTFQGYDSGKDMPLIEAAEEIIDIDAYTSNFDDWYKDFMPVTKAGFDGMLENPNIRSCVHRGQYRVGAADLRQSRRLFRRLPRRQARKSRRRVA